MKTKIKITGCSFNRIINNRITEHTITLHLEGEIPQMGLELNEISKLAKRSAKDKYLKVKI